MQIYSIFLIKVIYLKNIRYIIFLLISFSSYCQDIIVDSGLILKHNEMILYLTSDSCSLVSKLNLKYSDFKNITGNRDNNWFSDFGISRYHRKFYYKSGYDIGHLTPSNIVSYNQKINKSSFSFYNSAPQKPSFNRGSWLKLEKTVEDSVRKYKIDVIIISGVIYNNNSVNYIKGSRIPIPIYFLRYYILIT